METRLRRTDKYLDSVSNQYSKKWWSFVMQYKHKIDWDKLSRNPNLTIDIINEHPDNPWN